MRNFIATILLLAGVAFGQSTVAPAVNSNANAASGPAANVTATSGLGIRVSPGPVYCAGTLDYIGQTDFTTPASTTTYVVLDCTSGRLKLLRSPADSVNTQVQIATVLSGATTVTTVTDNRLAAQFPLWTDGYIFLSASNCQSSVSGNSAGTNGATTVGTAVTPVMQAQTSGVGTNTHTYVCNLALPTRITANRAALINDVTFLYGVQTTGLGTQVAVLASGTMNGSTVFSTITYPTAAGAETPSTVTPVRADSGTLTITPAVASSNVATTTAGGFYSVKFTPATAITAGTDLTQVLLTVSLLNTATSATITNSPGFIIHFTVPIPA